jgi:TetR/AcrR family transcriptional regulator, regulator of cefoperazone and chloramphenicol sensitivity
MSDRKQRDSGATKAAIVEAAGALFADRGFSGVTARAVAARAEVALSAIPYHFGSMEALYKAALLEACRLAPDAERLAKESLAAEPLEGVVVAARWAIADGLAADSDWGIRLLVREEFNPSPVFAEVLELKFRPEWKWLCEVVARASDRDADSAAVKFGTIVLYTTAVSFILRSSVLDALAPEVGKSFADQHDALAGCVASLALDAVERYDAAFGPGKSTKQRSTSSAKASSGKTPRQRVGEP